MTREEALAILDTIPTIGEQVDALEMAIDALKHPRQQCIAKIELPKEELEKIFQKVLHEQVQVLPPERKTGKWIGDNGKEVFLDEFGNTEHSSTCSVCGDWLIGSDEYACRGRYCPNCGAKMEVDE